MARGRTRAMIDFSLNHFELFGVPARFGVDTEALERAYRALQNAVHPDRHATGADSVRRLALQSSARVNEAYRALKDPVTRAQYLLSLRGIDAADETDTALPFDFLERQLERREAVAEAAAAADDRALGIMLDAVRGEARLREQELERLLDRDSAWDAARQRVRELKFLDKLADDIDLAITATET